MRVDLKAVEEASKELYIRALKVLPPDIKAGFTRLSASETGGTARNVPVSYTHLTLPTILRV